MARKIELKATNEVTRKEDKNGSVVCCVAMLESAEIGKYNFKVANSGIKPVENVLSIDLMNGNISAILAHDTKTTQKENSEDGEEHIHN